MSWPQNLKIMFDSVIVKWPHNHWSPTIKGHFHLINTLDTLEFVYNTLGFDTKTVATVKIKIYNALQSTTSPLQIHLVTSLKPHKVMLSSQSTRTSHHLRIGSIACRLPLHTHTHNYGKAQKAMHNVKAISTSNHFQGPTYAVNSISYWHPSGVAAETKTLGFVRTLPPLPYSITQGVCGYSH